MFQAYNSTCKKFQTFVSRVLLIVEQTQIFILYVVLFHSTDMLKHFYSQFRLVWTGFSFLLNNTLMSFVALTSSVEIKTFLFHFNKAFKMKGPPKRIVSINWKVLLEILQSPYKVIAAGRIFVPLMVERKANISYSFFSMAKTKCKFSPKRLYLFMITGV